MDYLSDPAAIYEKSFAIIAKEVDLGRFNEAERAVAIRLIHASGMPDIVGDLVFSTGAAEAGIGALSAGAPILCDAGMVRGGIIERLIPAGNPVRCEVAGDMARAIAERAGTTRSAGAMEVMMPELEGAVVAIGNAPTALYRLLEGLDAGWPRPALILGFPVGFVGAAESKAELIADSRGVPFIALNGRRGGSAMAAAAVNALMIGAGGR